MQVIVAETIEGFYHTGADIVASIVAERPSASVVLATGDTPMGVYHELALRRGRGELDASSLRAFQLDAYLGIAPDDERSLYAWLERSFLHPLGVPDAHVVRLRGDAPDPGAECVRYDDAVREAGGFDLAVLGLGPNGHLGFNEPPVAPDDSTRVVALTEASIVSNGRYWGGRDRVPPRALTAGMAALLGARQTLLLVSGGHKREILRRTVEEPANPMVPASYLQTASSVTVLVDRDACP